MHLIVINPALFCKERLFYLAMKDFYLKSFAICIIYL